MSSSCCNLLFYDLSFVSTLAGISGVSNEKASQTIWKENINKNDHIITVRNPDNLEKILVGAMVIKGVEKKLWFEALELEA